MWVLAERKQVHINDMAFEICKVELLISIQRSMYFLHPIGKTFSVIFLGIEKPQIIRNRH